MRLIRTGIFVLLLLSAKLGSAQLGLSINTPPSTYFIDTSGYINTYLHINLAITGVQIGPTPITITSFLGAGFYVDSSGAGGIGPVILQDTTYSGGHYSTIGPGISVVGIDSILVRSQFFRTGINTVVIWPRIYGGGIQAIDTLRQNVYILGYLGTKPNITTDKMVLYPNPFSSVIWIKNSTGNFVERVRIFDVLGQEIISKEMYNNNKLDLTNLVPGVYFVHLQTKDGKLTIIKTIKE